MNFEVKNSKNQNSISILARIVLVKIDQKLRDTGWKKRRLDSLYNERSPMMIIAGDGNVIRNHQPCLISGTNIAQGFNSGIDGEGRERVCGSVVLQVSGTV